MAALYSVPGYRGLLLWWRAHSAWVIRMGFSLRRGEDFADNSKDPRYNFRASSSIEELIAQQGKVPITDVSALHGDFRPEEENIEDFIAALHEWRGHKRSGPVFGHDKEMPIDPAAIQVLALRQIADRLEHGEMMPDPAGRDLRHSLRSSTSALH